MIKLRSVICIMLLVCICVITGTACSHMTAGTSKVSSPGGFESEATVSASDDGSKIGSTVDALYDIEYITAERVRSVDEGTTYREIVTELSDSSTEDGIGFKLYIVDGQKLLVLRFDDIEDRCDLSGEQLLSTAKSLSYPHGELPEPLDPGHTVNYAIVVGQNMVCTVDNGRAECYKILLGDADIVLQNGDRADQADMELMSGVVVTYDYMLDSIPRQAHCIKAVIVD